MRCTRPCAGRAAPRIAAIIRVVEDLPFVPSYVDRLGSGRSGEGEHGHHPPHPVEPEAHPEQLERTQLALGRGFRLGAVVLVHLRSPPALLASR